MYNDIKPRVKKIKADPEDIWQVFYESDSGKVYEFKHKKYDLAIKTWYKKFSRELNIKPLGGGGG